MRGLFSGPCTVVCGMAGRGLIHHPPTDRPVTQQFAAVRAQTDVPLERSDLWVEFMERLGVRRRGDDDDELEVMQTQQVRRPFFHQCERAGRLLLLLDAGDGCTACLPIHSHI